MPERNRDAVADVTRHILRLTKATEFKHKAEGLKPTTSSRIDDTNVFHVLFSDLNERDKRDVLTRFIDWSGFTREQSKRVIDNVIEQHRESWSHQPVTTRWFDGVVPTDPHKADEALRRAEAQVANCKQIAYGAANWRDLRGDQHLDLVLNHVNWEGVSERDQFRVIAREIDLNRLHDHQQRGVLQKAGIQPDSVMREDGFFDPTVDAGLLAKMLGVHPTWAAAPKRNSLEALRAVAKANEQARPKVKDRGFELER